MFETWLHIPPVIVAADRLSLLGATPALVKHNYEEPDLMLLNSWSINELNYLISSKYWSSFLLTTKYVYLKHLEGICVAVMS